MEELPKILFLTVNGWNNTTGTATIPSIISGYPSEKIANIYIRPDVPDSLVCNKYFNLSESDVFRSIFKSNYNVGNEITPGVVNNDLINENANHKNLKRKKIPFVKYFRDGIWKFGHWKSQSLQNFVNEFDPDVIAFPAEGIISFLNIAEYLINFTKKPYIIFFWDDNFSLWPHRLSIYRLILRRKIKYLAQNSAGAFAIVPKMQREIEKDLNCHTCRLSRPMIISKIVHEKTNYSTPIKILYTGSTYIDRDKTIKIVIDAISELNKKGCLFTIDIYTNSEVNRKVIKEKPGVVEIHPGVRKNELLELQQAADILLFVEATKGPYKYAARLSFSTKLTDYMSAKRTILAVGPYDIAPIEYLHEEDAALIAHDYDTLLILLQRIWDNRDTILKEYAKKSYTCGERNHSAERIYSTFCHAVIEATK